MSILTFELSNLYCSSSALGYCLLIWSGFLIRKASLFSFLEIILLLLRFLGICFLLLSLVNFQLLWLLLISILLILTFKFSIILFSLAFILKKLESLTIKSWFNKSLALNLLFGSFSIIELRNDLHSLDKFNGIPGIPFFTLCLSSSTLFP